MSRVELTKRALDEKNDRARKQKSERTDRVRMRACITEYVCMCIYMCVHMCARMCV